MNEKERQKIMNEPCDQIGPDGKYRPNHKWRQKLVCCNNSLMHGGFYCIHCLKEVDELNLP